MVKQAWVVVKFAEWWLEPTTPNQCGENPAIHASAADTSIPPNDLFDRSWVYSLRAISTCQRLTCIDMSFSDPSSKLSLFKPRIIMHTHLHLLQWLSSSIPTEEERSFISRGMSTQRGHAIWRRIRYSIFDRFNRGNLILDEYLAAVKHLTGL